MYNIAGRIPIRAVLPHSEVSQVLDNELIQNTYDFYVFFFLFCSFMLLIYITILFVNRLFHFLLASVILIYLLQILWNPFLFMCT